MNRQKALDLGLKIQLPFDVEDKVVVINELSARWSTYTKEKLQGQEATIVDIKPSIYTKGSYYLVRITATGELWHFRPDELLPMESI